MTVTITSIGNAGFHIATPEATVLVDAFYHPIPGVAEPPSQRGRDIQMADLILVTHSHFDHFSPDEVAEVAQRTGAQVIGSESVTRKLAGQLDPRQIMTLEPPPAGKGWANSLTADLPFAKVVAFRTFHSQDHNSYLVEVGGFRFFHDGDNGLTHRFAPGCLDRLDALLIGPWEGSGWVDFIEKLAPRRYFLMHLTQRELEETLAGTFLSEICDRVPEGLVVLRPGESYALES